MKKQKFAPRPSGPTSAPPAAVAGDARDDAGLPGSPFEILAEYERLALEHVAGLPEQMSAPGLWRGVGYRIGRQRLASGFEEVVEILPLPSLTPVPGAQPWMLGVANLRGNLLPVVDLKQFLEGERTVLHEGQRMLVVRQRGGDVAVLIDELFGQRSFNEPQLIDAAELDAGGRYGQFHRARLPARRAGLGHLQPRAPGTHPGIPTSSGLSRNTARSINEVEP